MNDRNDRAEIIYESIVLALSAKFSGNGSKFLALSSVLLALCFISCWILYPDNASSGPYLDSAHGNQDYGVSRPRTAGFGYAMGNCAHCHEQHASIGGVAQTAYGYELFYDHWIGACNLFCYRCHSEIEGVEQKVNNYLYSCNFGGEGCASTSYTTVREHFCNANSDFDHFGSKHNLREIRDIIEDNGYGWGFPDDPNPCSACHNPHLVQRVGNIQYLLGYEPDKSLIVRPSEHGTSPLNLWGDDSPTERMSYYAQTKAGGVYQAPYYGSFYNLYEPSGTSYPSDGSDLPDYATFCGDCHQYQQYDSERSRIVKAINWGTTGDRHGGYPSNDCSESDLGIEKGSLRAPYSNSISIYVLSCTDCHEPHAGRKRIHLIRRFINGEAVAAGTSSSDNTQDNIEICIRCHNVTADHLANTTCLSNNCHGHGVKWPGEGPCQNKPNF